MRFFYVSVLMATVAAFTASAKADTPSTESIKGRINQALHDGQSLKTLYAKLTEEFGTTAIKPLVEITSDEHSSDETRWAALFGLARLAGKQSIGIIGKLMHHSSWMLRDAALKTSAALGAHELAPHIEKLLKDDALIVRTTAVQTISHLNLKQSAPKLVAALSDPANFHGGKALWIHKYVLQAIRDFHYTAAVPKLVELLQNTQDENLQAQLLQTLESLTGRSYANKPLQEQIYLWKRSTVSELTF